MLTESRVGGRNRSRHQVIGELHRSQVNMTTRRDQSSRGNKRGDGVEGPCLRVLQGFLSFYFILFYLFIFIFGCVGSSLLHTGFL